MSARLARACLCLCELFASPDLNFHIDFIASAANVRAVNYSIPQTTRHEAKMIAGRIIPAMSTTTACITGLVMLEMLKVVQSKPADAYRDSNIGLAAGTFQVLACCCRRGADVMVF